MPQPGNRGHARAFRLLLRLLPGTFRAAYGEEMTALVLARLERARSEGGRFATVRLWGRTALDVVRTALAERLARREHGGSGGRGRIGTQTGGGEDMETLAQDIRYAVRRLGRTPLFTLSAVAILALGIGANTAAFSLVDALLFRPPPFERPEEIVSVYQDSDDGDPSSTSFPAYRDMAAATDVFALVAAVSTESATWEAADGPRPVSVEYATASLLPMLGLAPSRGRWFSAEQDHVGAGLFAVVSHRTWRTAMGADPDVVGRTVRLNGQPVTVIGVGPESYNGSGGALATDFWLSISSTPVGGAFRVANLERRQDHWYDVKARLAPGVSLARARAAMDGLAQRLAEAFPELNRGRDITVFGHDEVRFHPEADGGLRSAGFGLLGVVGLLLVLACSNLANLLLVRGVSRAPETAVRQAMGASGGRLARLFLAESILLALAGGAAGVLLASWLITLVPRLPLPLPDGMALDVAVDHRVVTFGVVLALATGVLFGLAPALRSARADVAATLREDRRSASSGRSLTLLRNGLVAVQVAVSVVLVVGSGLFARSLANASRVDAGVDAERVALLGTSLSQAGMDDGEARVVVEEVLGRIASLPGVRSAGITSRLPVQPGGTTTTVVEGYEPATGTGSVELAYAVASAGYFETVGIPLLEGRVFGPDDRPGEPLSVLVNETAAERFWGGEALGKRIRPQGAPDAWRTVVGVVGDAKVGDLGEGPTPMFYYGAEQVTPGSFTVVARADGDPAALAPALRRELRAVSPALPVTRLGTLEDHLGAALAGPRTTAALFGGFSFLALLLASLGIYAVVSFTVARRAGEMGVRAALGAARGRLVRMVVAESLVTVAVGVAAGLAVAFAAAPALEGVLFDVGAGDPATFVGGAALLTVVAGLASWLPARRAAGADPVDALRAQ